VRQLVLITLLLLFFFPLFPTPLQAAKSDVYDLPKVVALQPRKYYLNSELALHVGYLPLDAFTKSALAGASFTYFFSDFTAWEIVNYNYGFSVDTGLKNDLKDYFEAQPEDDRLLDYAEWYVTTSFIYTPLYNKSLFFNRSVVHGETSFLISGGSVKLLQEGMKPLVGAGFIMRYFTSPGTSLKFDFRTNMYFSDVNGAKTILSLIVGFAMQLGSDPNETPDDGERNDF
jgi:outer membrane beta-barrel protein